jgi:hypothetical protein
MDKKLEIEPIEKFVGGDRVSSKAESYFFIVAESSLIVLLDRIFDGMPYRLISL